MNLIEEAIVTLGVPGSVAVVILILFAVLQLIGEFIEACGKVSPAFLSIRRYIKKRNELKKKQIETLESVQKLLADVNKHYDKDNIAKRDSWMQWVNSRATVYDSTIQDYKDITAKLTKAVEDNTAMTQQMFIENSRDRIIDFASKVSNPLSYVSREEFNRIFKIYRKYEDFLQEHNLTNGEVEVNYQIIKDAYADHVANHRFVEEMREQNNNNV